MSRRNRNVLKTGQQIRLKSAHYVVNGRNILIPTVCVHCRQKGLVLVYNYKEHRMEAICGARENQLGQFIKGCDKISFAIPMAEYEYNIIIDDPHTTDYFFFLRVLSR